MNPIPQRTPTGEPEEPHGVTVPLPHHAVPYFKIFFILVALTIITLLLNSVHYESEAVNVLLCLTVASIKAAFVAYFFMHLKFEGKLIYFIFLVPLCLCVLLVVALIPDVMRGRLVAFNDIIAFFQAVFNREGPLIAA